MTTVAQQAPVPEPVAGFSPTLPPPDAAAPLLSHEAARVLFPLGMKGLRASIIDVGSMACLSTWTIGDVGPRGATAEDAGGASFPTAMATIVHLNGTPFDQTLTRQIDAQRWVCAWRIDDHRVAVAEARYRQPKHACAAADTAVVRQLCTAGLDAGSLPPADADADADAGAGDGAGDAHRAPPAPGPLAAARLPAAVPPRSAAWADRLALRLRWPALWGSGAAGALCLLGALQIGSSAQGEALRLRQLSDATMTQQLARVLVAGDYGEVQVELDTFAGLGHFKGAVVVDARGRAVASAGAVPTLRIGQALAGPAVADARVVSLQAAAGRNDGQLLVWGAAAPGPRVGAVVGPVLFVAGLLLLLATLAGAALLWRRRQPLPLFQPPP